MTKILPLLAVLLSTGLAQAADLPSRGLPASVLAPESVVTSPSWAGFYAGLNFGAVRADALEGRGYWIDKAGTYVTIGGSGRSGGASGGFQFGYNAQMNQIVYGVELDALLNFVDVNGLAAQYDIKNNVASDRLKSRTNIPALTSLRGRLGYVVGQTLFYVTGGPTVGLIRREVTQVDDNKDYQWLAAGERNSFSKTRLGWTAGAGVEYQMTGALSLRAQYLFTGLGRPAFHYVGYPYGVIDQGDQHIRLYQSAVSLGVNYKFGQ